MPLDISLRARLLLSVTSGIGCTLVWFLEPDLASLFENLWFYGLSGLFFAAGVLYPYIRQDKFMHLRGTALVALSAVAYWGAIIMTIDHPLFETAGFFTNSREELINFMVGSFAGASMVMIAVVLIAPVRISLAYPVFCVVASFLGGVIMNVAWNQDGFWALGIGYVAWHMLICLAIYFGTRRECSDHQAMP